MAVNMAVH